MRVLLAICICLAFAGCRPTGIIAQTQDDKICQGYGFAPDTVEYANCRAALYRERTQNSYTTPAEAALSWQLLALYGRDWFRRFSNQWRIGEDSGYRDWALVLAERGDV